MLTNEAAQALLSDLESDHVERTTTTRDTDKFAQAVCAFANDFPRHGRPGYLFVGVTDAGAPSGLTVTDQLLQNLAALRSDGNIQPIPALTVTRIVLPGGEVAVVEVLPSDLPPVRYRGQVWIRVGPRRAIASEQEERILIERRTSAASSFDARPCRQATLADLALGIFDGYRREAVAPAIIDENHRPLEQQLASLRFLDVGSGCPTNAGVLLLGKQPRHWLPGAYVQYIRFPGTTLGDVPVDQAEIAGDLQAVVRELLVRLRVLIRTAMAMGPALEERLVPDYPEVALRELLLNAVMHRNYESHAPIRLCAFEDRIEILSPGGLYGEATPENFPNRNSYRNPVIAEALKTLGYVNRFGYGVERARRLLADNGNPPPEFEIDARTVNVRIFHR